MKVVLDQSPQPTNGAVNAPASPSGPRVSAPSAAPNSSETPASSTTGTTAQSTVHETQNRALPAGTPQTNVTFRRDAQGQFYYVITDAQSGRELQQVPPEELRKVGEGIEEFLQQQQSKAASRLATKA
jgi:uncharacterized FlaG/YvyC family protein